MAKNYSGYSVSTRTTPQGKTAYLLRGAKGTGSIKLTDWMEEKELRGFITKNTNLTTSEVDALFKQGNIRAQELDKAIGVSAIPTTPTTTPAQATPITTEQYQMTQEEMMGGAAGQAAYTARIAALRAGTVTTPTATTPTATTTTVSATDTGDPTLNAILASVNKLLSDAEAQGKKINPNADLETLAKAALDEAIATVDPYYASQVKSIRADLEQGITSLAKEYELAKEEKAAQYRQSLGIQQETEAGKGTIFSGGRIQRERELGASAARSFESLATQTAEAARAAGQTTEKTIGSLGLTGYQMPTIGQYGVGPTSQLAPTTRTLWTPEGGIIGSLERERDVIREQTRRELLAKKQEESLWL